MTSIPAPRSVLSLVYDESESAPCPARAWEPDGALRDRARSGDEAAQRVIFERHVDRVFRIAHRIAGDIQLAEDITQDAFVRMFERLGQFREASRFTTWLHAIVVSVALNAVRKQQRWWSREIDIAHAAPIPARESGIDHDLRDRVRVAVAALPDDQRVILVMHDIEGYSHEEIALSMSISAGACRMRLKRARDVLRERLGADGLEWNR